MPSIFQRILASARSNSLYLAILILIVLVAVATGVLVGAHIDNTYNNIIPTGSE
jgi:hypothetical protein